MKKNDTHTHICRANDRKKMNLPHLGLKGITNTDKGETYFDCEEILKEFK